MPFWVLNFTETKDKERPLNVQAEALLNARVWGIKPETKSGSRTPNRDNVEEGHHVLAFAGRDEQVFVGHAKVTERWHPWHDHEKDAHDEANAGIEYPEVTGGFALEEPRIWKERLPVDSIWEQTPDGQERPGSDRRFSFGINKLRHDATGHLIIEAAEARQARRVAEPPTDSRQIEDEELMPQRTRRSPVWGYDELILALALYKRSGLLDDSHPKVKELSRVLNALPVHREVQMPETFRNPNGVAMKLANFAELDRPGSGLPHGGRRDREVWERFRGREVELQEVADEIRTGVRTGQGLPAVTEEEEPPEVSEAREEAARLAGRPARGARRFSAQDRQAVEMRAMAAAERHYRDAGWEVEDVSATESYDLRCRRAAEEIHVEVKGTTTAIPQVVLTGNEVAHARHEHSNVALVFVSGIRLERAGSEPRATGGSLRVIEPWRLDDGDA